MRRIRYLVEFTLPSEEIRRQIWESSFAPEVPLEDVNKVRDLTLDSLNKANTARPIAGSSRKDNHPVLKVFLEKEVRSKENILRNLEKQSGEHIEIRKRELQEELSMVKKALEMFK
mgnify:CR=1 FL=1